MVEEPYAGASDRFSRILGFPQSVDSLERMNRTAAAWAPDFFDKNRGRMRYGRYREAGYPIATGVIEGACRPLVKDRLERAGMRWVLQGAQSMLHLRSVHLSGF